MGENRVVGHVFDSCQKSQLISLFFLKIARTFQNVLSDLSSFACTIACLRGREPTVMSCLLVAQC